MINRRPPAHAYSTAPYGTLAPVVGDAFSRLQVDVGGGAGPAFLLADTVGTLQQLGANLSDGAVARVTQQLLDFFVLHRDDPDPPDGITTFAAVGGGTWVRQIMPDVYWLRQASWGVDAAGGDDLNEGTVASPLRTATEYLRRVRMGQNLAMLEQFVTVNVLGDTEPEIFEMWPALPLQAAGTVQFDGTMGQTVVASGVIATVTPAVPATNTRYTLTATGIANFTPLISSVCVVTGGARAGSMFTITAGSSGATAQVSVPSEGAFLPTPVTLQVGDPFDVLSLPSFCESVGVQGQGFVNFASLGLASLGAPQHAVQIRGVFCFIDSCQVLNGLDSLSGSYVGAINCYLAGGARAEEAGSKLVLDVGASAPGTPITARNMGVVDLDNFTSFAPIVVDAGGLVQLIRPGMQPVEPCGYLSVFDSTGAMRVEQGGIFDSSLDTGSAGGEVWGAGVAGTTAGRVNLSPGGWYFYRAAANAPNIAGTGQEISVGGVGGATTYAGLPSVNTNNLAQAVVG